jgi:PAS domain S-box-containing protein
MTVSPTIAIDDLCIGVCTLDERHGIRAVNSTFCGLFGGRPAEWTGRALLDLARQMDVTPFLAACRQAALTRTVCTFGAVVQVAGATRQVKIQVVPTGKSDLLAILIDLTEEMNARDEQQLQLDRFQAFLDQSPFIAWVRNAEEQYVYINETYRTHYQLKPSDRLGRTPFDVWPSETAWQFHRNDLRVLAGNEPQSVVEHAPDPDGAMRTWFNVKFPITTTEGRALIAGVGLDITSHEQTHEQAFQNRLAEQVRQAEENARLIHLQQLQSLALLASGATHDINNMLAAVTVYSGLLTERLQRDETSLEYLQQIREAADEVMTLCKRLLSFYRRSSPPQTESINLSHVITDISGMLSGVVTSPHRLELHLEENLPPIRADRRQMRQVLLNLVVNAKDALVARDNGHPAPGVVEIKTRARYPARSQGLARVELQIRDDGVGLTAEGQARLYEPFYTTKRDGHGLGLAAVRTILDQQNATIQCDSTPGVGTTFLVSFPVESTD